MFAFSPLVKASHQDWFATCNCFQWKLPRRPIFDLICCRPSSNFAKCSQDFAVVVLVVILLLLVVVVILLLRRLILQSAAKTSPWRMERSPFPFSGLIRPGSRQWRIYQSWSKDRGRAEGHGGEPTDLLWREQSGPHTIPKSGPHTIPFLHIPRIFWSSWESDRLYSQLLKK